MRLVLRFVSSVRDRLRRAMRNDAFLFLPRRSLLHSHPHLHFRYLQSQHSMHRAHATWYPVIPLYVVCDCCPWAATDGELLALGEIPSLAAAHGSSGLSNTGITTSMPLGAPWKRWNYAASATLRIAADNAALRPTHDCGDVKNSWQSQSWWFNPSVSPCASNAGWGRTKVQLLLPPMQLTQAILGLTWYIGPTPLSLHAGWPLCPREVRCPSMWAEGLHMRECSGASPESCLLFL